MEISEQAAGKRSVMAMVVGTVLVGLAGALTFVVVVHERRCAPLELGFQIHSKTSPEREGAWDRGRSSAQAPDPTGWVSVTTGGKRHGETIAQRKNTYSFRGRFYSRRGVPLGPGSTIAVTLLDKDLGSAEGVGEIEHQVWLPGSGSATSSNGIVEMVYTCHSDSRSARLYQRLETKWTAFWRKLSVDWLGAAARQKDWGLASRSTWSAWSQSEGSREQREEPSPRASGIGCGTRLGRVGDPGAVGVGVHDLAGCGLAATPTERSVPRARAARKDPSRNSASVPPKVSPFA